MRSMPLFFYSRPISETDAPFGFFFPVRELYPERVFRQGFFYFFRPLDEDDVFWVGYYFFEIKCFEVAVAVEAIGIHVVEI